MMNSENDRRPRWLLAVVLLAVFGPYVAGGMRTEQLAVYSVGCVATTAILYRHRQSARAVVPLAVVWLIFFGTAAVAAWLPPIAVGPWEPRSLTAGLDNLVLPLAALVVGVWLSIVAHDPVRLLRNGMMWIVALMMVNSLAVVLQMMGVSWRPWWSASSVAETVAQKAEGNWRYSGLINQPAESGFLYSLAVVLAVVLLSRRPAVMGLCLTVLAVGAVSAVSKIFLLFGAPMAVVMYLCLSKHWRRDLLALTLLAGALIAVLTSSLLDSWSGSYQLRQIMPSSGESILSSLTASRFGETSTLLPVVQAVWDSSPIIGVGAGGLDVPYDNAWLEAFIVAGVIGVVCVSLVLALVALRWKETPRGLARTVLGLLFVLVVLTNTGLPTLTANRCSTLVWVMLGLAWLNRSHIPATDGEAVGRNSATSQARDSLDVGVAQKGG